MIGRHSRSVDVERQVCGSCKGRLEYVGKGTRAAIKQQLRSKKQHRQGRSGDGEGDGFGFGEENVHENLLTGSGRRGKQQQQQERALNPYARFVKENYSAAREGIVLGRREGRGRGRPPKSDSAVAHADVMKALSEQWADRKGHN